MKQAEQRIRRRNGKKALSLLLAFFLLLFVSCAAEQQAPDATVPADTALPAETCIQETTASLDTPVSLMTEPAETGREDEPDRIFYAHVNGKVLKILSADNSSAAAFLSLLKTGDITIEMRDYGNFEKVGPLGNTLPQNDEQITTEAGDVILYQGNQITIYYAENRWSFSRLGKIQDISQAELIHILGEGNVTVIFSLSPLE